MSLEITHIQVNKREKTRESDKILAFAKITIGDCFCIDGFKIINGSKGIFVGMPSKKQTDGTFRDTAFPINKETRQLINDSILKEYNKDSKDDKEDLFS